MSFHVSTDLISQHVMYVSRRIEAAAVIDKNRNDQVKLN